MTESPSRLPCAPVDVGVDRRAGLAGFAALIALSAWGGALGLILDFLGLPTEIEQRLPLSSPVLGGIALALIVALPSTVLARLAWHGDPRTDVVALVAGILIAGWIVVEYLFIRELSFFHPTYLVIAGVLMWVGRHALPELAARVGPDRHRHVVP